MSQSILHLVRHAQTDWNAERRLQGHVDIPLNEAGIAEAEKLAEEFADHSLDAIYSSPLIRAHATAQIINRPHGHLIKTYDALKEATYGSLEGMKLDDYHRTFHHPMDSHERIHFKMVPDAESYFEVYERVMPVLYDLAEQHLGKTVLIVSHGGLIRGVIAMLMGIDVREIHVENVGCLTLQGDGSKLSIADYKRIKIQEPK